MSDVLAKLWTSYVQGNLFFVVLHGLLLVWAIRVFVRAAQGVRRDASWLGERDAGGASRLAALWTTLRSTGNAGRLELRDLYEARASVDSDDLARIANLLLLIGVAGTLWSLLGAAQAVQVKLPDGQEIDASEALSPILRSFYAFSVTVVSVGLAFFILVLQRVLSRAIANVACDAAQRWEGAVAGVDGAAGDLRAAVAELTASVQSLGPNGHGDWARTEVQRVTAELTANAQAASQQMIAVSGAFATAFSDAVTPLTSRVTAALEPLVKRLDGVTAALDSSMRSLDVQHQLLEKHAAALEVIHGHLSSAERVVEHLREVPAMVGSNLQDIGKHVAGTLETVHGSFEGKLERIFKLHEGAVLTVATRMQDTESKLASSVERATSEVKQYLLHQGNSVSGAVEGMLANAARASDASIWTPVRSAVEGVGAIAQRTTHSVAEVERTSVAALDSVQRSVATLGERARAFAGQLDGMRDAMAGAGTLSPRDRRSATVAQWVSTGVLALAMFVLCTLFYTRLGR